MLGSWSRKFWKGRSWIPSRTFNLRLRNLAPYRYQQSLSRCITCQDVCI